jgi:[methyl-Co(III) methanol-specific corrinoid protein]:coenzyme M methyltransferase
MTEKERLLSTLEDKKVDRPPVICPGGMMTMASREVMIRCGCRWPDVHRDAAKMAALSLAMHDETGLENLGIPFCMTVEAEALGGEIEDGDEVTEPSLVVYPLQSVSEWTKLRAFDPYSDGRLPTILECTKSLAAQRPDTPVTGNLVGPLSLATSLIDAIPLFKALRKEPQEAHGLLSFLTDNIVSYGEALVRSGADVIVIADPSATGEILGPKLFREFALPYLNRITDSMHALGMPVVVHICGNVKSVYGELKALTAECMSVDSVVDVGEVKAALPDKRIMGNVSTILLQKGPADRITQISRAIIDRGVDILAPACGISALTPAAHLRAMSDAAGARS